MLSHNVTQLEARISCLLVYAQILDNNMLYIYENFFFLDLLIWWILKVLNVQQRLLFYPTPSGMAGLNADFVIRQGYDTTTKIYCEHDNKHRSMNVAWRQNTVLITD